MSGPVLIDAFGSALGHAEVNRMAVNGVNGVAAMFIEPVLLLFSYEIYIDGKLGAREKVCAPVRDPYERAARRANLVPICSRVK